MMQCPACKAYGRLARCEERGKTAVLHYLCPNGACSRFLKEIGTEEVKTPERDTNAPAE